MAAVILTSPQNYHGGFRQEQRAVKGGMPGDSQAAKGIAMVDSKNSLDVLVAGAGYVGLAAAVSLKQARPSLA
ncbi:MAG: hypothetical protein E5W81_15255, partial [Mesorhizobium sp.]